MDSRGTLDNLEPESQGVEHGDHPPTDTEREDGTKEDASLAENARRDRGIFLAPDLHDAEGNGQNASDNKESNDPAVVPGVIVASPLEG